MTDSTRCPECNEAATIREWLETVGGVDRVDASSLGGSLEQILDLPATPQLMSTEGTGNLQITCGGDVLFRLGRYPASAARVYLVRDDSEGRAWDVQMRSGPLGRARNARPHARLRLVVSI